MRISKAHRLLPNLLVSPSYSPRPPVSHQWLSCNFIPNGAKCAHSRQLLLLYIVKSEDLGYHCSSSIRPCLPTTAFRAQAPAPAAQATARPRPSASITPVAPLAPHQPSPSIVHQADPTSRRHRVRRHCSWHNHDQGISEPALCQLRARRYAHRGHDNTVYNMDARRRHCEQTETETLTLVREATRVGEDGSCLVEFGGLTSLCATTS